MTLRKGSLNKIIFVKKDQLKLLRLSHLLTNRNDKTERSNKKNKEKYVLPDILAKFKNQY